MVANLQVNSHLINLMDKFATKVMILTDSCKLSSLFIAPTD